MSNDNNDSSNNNNNNSRLEAASRHFESILTSASQYLDNNDEDILPEQLEQSFKNNNNNNNNYNDNAPAHQRKQHHHNHNRYLHPSSSYNPIPFMRERENLLISSRIDIGSSSRDKSHENNVSFARSHPMVDDTIHSFAPSSSAPRPLKHDRDYYAKFTNRLNKVQTTTNRIENSHIDDEVEPLGAKEREDLIVTLQNEVARLKAKLTGVITSAESTITDAQFAQDDMQAHYVAEFELLTEKNQILQEENTNLRTMLKESNENLTIERDLLLRSVKYMERLRLRGKSLNSNLDRKTLVRDLREYRGKEHEYALKRSSSKQSRVW